MRRFDIDKAALRGPVAVLMGGNSAEREVSLESGRAVHAALTRRLDGVLAIDAGADVLRRLIAAGVAHVFIALHGRGGEDGTMQGALQTLGISYTGSGVLACALAMDKLRCKRFWQAEGIATPDFAVADVTANYDELAARLGPRLIVKPASEGSSIGITPVDNAAELRAAVALASGYDSCVLVERRVMGPEYTVAIVDGEILPSIRLETPRTFYDYEAKYQLDTTRYLCPSGLDAGDERALAALAARAFDSLGCSGWGRVDVMRDAASGEFAVLEVNTAPGMTSHSLVPMAARAVGIEFDDLVVRIFSASLAGGARGGVPG
jgi:D-alanine-D-alanine ligase